MPLSTVMKRLFSWLCQTNPSISLTAGQVLFGLSVLKSADWNGSLRGLVNAWHVYVWFEWFYTLGFPDYTFLTPDEGKHGHSWECQAGLRQRNLNFSVFLGSVCFHSTKNLFNNFFRGSTFAESKHVLQQSQTVLKTNTVATAKNAIVFSTQAISAGSQNHHESHNPWTPHHIGVISFES